MRVLHVAPYASLEYGGPTVALRSMARGLVARGVEVDVVTTNASVHGDMPFPDGTFFEENGVNFRYFKRRVPRGWFRATGMARWLQEHVCNYDLLHLHVPFTWPFRAGALVATSVGRPYIATLHGVLDPWSLRQKAWKKKPYLGLLERRVIAGAQILHVTAPLERDFVSAMHFGPEVHCLPLAVPLPAAGLLRQPRQDCVRLLCVARIHPVKGLPVLFKALSQLRNEGCNVYLDLAGSGEAGYVTELKKYSRSLGIEDVIVWHGQVDEVEKRTLYAQADCFVLLSYHENFGLAAAEAMAAGVPVVVSDQVGLAPDVSLFHAGTVVPVGNHVEAARSLRKLIDPATNISAGMNARRLVENSYGEQAFGDGLVKLYEHGLARARARSA